MSKRWASVILQRTKQRIGVGPVTGRGEETAAAIAAEIVAVRNDRAECIGDVRARSAAAQNAVPDFHRCVTPGRTIVEDAAATAGRVAAEGAGVHTEDRVAGTHASVADAATVDRRVRAEGAGGDEARRGAANAAVGNAASVGAGQVAVEGSGVH